MEITNAARRNVRRNPAPVATVVDVEAHTDTIVDSVPMIDAVTDDDVASVFGSRSERGYTNVGRTTRPVIRASLVRRVPDFSLSSDVMRGAFALNPADCGIWGAIFDACDATDDERSYIVENACE